MTENAVGVQEIKEILGCSADTVYRLVKDKTIPGFKVGRDWRFFPTEVRKALTSSDDDWARPSRKRVIR